MSVLMRAIDRERRRKVEDIIVFKCGGSSVDDLSEDFFNNIKVLQAAGKKPVIVHGGGPAIEKLLNQLNIGYEFVDGLRKTTDNMMDIVEMVLSGNVNPALTRTFNAFGIQALGLTGSDQMLLEATAIDEDRYGQVGEVKFVHTEVIETIVEKGIVPIISPVAINKDYKRFNVNADTAAGAVARALRAEQLLFVTDVPGILREGSLLEEVTTDEIDDMIQDGTIHGGMIPKVKAAMKGLQGNVKEVMIVNGKDSKMKTNTSLAGTIIQTEKKKVKVGN